MNEHIYKIVELTGSSSLSMEDAVKNALQRAAKTLHNLRWFEVTEIRGEIDKMMVKHWQLTIKVGFTLD